MYSPGGAEMTKCPYWFVATPGPQGPVGVPSVEQRLTLAPETGNPEGRPRTFPETVPYSLRETDPAHTPQSEHDRTNDVELTKAVADTHIVRLPGGATTQNAPERFVVAEKQTCWFLTLPQTWTVAPGIGRLLGVDSTTPATTASPVRFTVAMSR